MASFILNSTGIKKEAPQDVLHNMYQSQNNSQAPPMNDSLDTSHLQPPQSTSATAVTGALGQALLKPSIYEKCQALTSALSESNNIKELQYQYPTIIQKIFGFGMCTPGWQLEITHIGRSRRDSNAVLALLHPTGPLFTHLIHRLLTEDVVFEFPYTSIPEATRRRVEEGLPISELYGNKLTVSGANSYPMLILDAFEYFFFVFAHKMVSSSTKSQELYTEPCDWLYPTLLNDYLQYFLPMTGMPSSLPPPPKQSAIQPHRASSASFTPRRQGMGLLKQTSQLSRSISVQQSSSADNIDSDVMWRSERLVQVLSELWLAQTNIDMTPNSSSLRFSNSASEGLPSHDLVMLIRMFLKHVHAFIHSSDGNILPSHQQNPTTTLGSLKRNLLPRYIQKPLYAFLKHSVERWPLDTSFRPILETWLSFIRPWRYACSANQSRPAAPERGDDSAGVDLTNFVRNWGGFVRANSLFYTVIFQDVVSRFLRIDLTSSKMAFHLSRVCRVFALKEMVSILREVDMSVMSAPYAFHDPQDRSVTDVTDGAMGNSQLVLVKQINAIESASFVYQPMFGEDVVQQVQCLVQDAVNAQQNVRRRAEVHENKQKSSQGSSLLSFLGLAQMMEFNNAMSGSQDQELLSTDRWLDQSIQELCAIFNLQPPEYDRSSSPDRTSDSSYSKLPDHVTKADGSVELTALGRYQVLNGLKRFTNITSHCDPELQPVRSFESDLAVIQLYKISCALNKKFGAYFAEQYNKDGLAGCIARRLLLAPLRDGEGGSYPHHRHPRISLRIFANYYFIGYALVGYFVMSMVIGRAPTVILCLLFLWFYLLCVALVDYMKG